MKISYYPYSYDGNKYSKIIIDCLQSSGFKVIDFNKVIKDRSLRRETNIFIFNWIENIQSDNCIKVLAKFILRVFMIKNLKLRNKKIIWTMHNKVPHDLKQSKLAELLMKYIANSADKIIILSNETKNELKRFINEEEIKSKVVHIPHPNYIGQYPSGDMKIRQNLKINDDELVILFIGMIRSYKNIELIIDIANELNQKKVKFIIAGNPINDTYRIELEERIKNHNIIPIFKFIEDEEMISLIRESDIVLLPYDLDSSLNSGTILLSFSNRKTVISPLIGTLKDIENKNMFFTYEYLTELEHKEKIKKHIMHISDMEKSELKRMGIDCYNYVSENYSIKQIQDKYEKLFSSIIKE